MATPGHPASSVSDLDLEGAIARGRRAWPGVDVPAEECRRFWSELPGANEDRAVGPPHEDLYLACACLAGIAAAHQAFESSIMADVPKAVRRVSVEPDFAQDVVSDLRVALLFGAEGKPPLLTRYLGRGPLRSFVMVLAMRRALDRKRRVKEVLTQPSSLAKLEAEAAAFTFVGSDGLREAFVRALRESLAALTPRDRNVLRLHVVEGVSAEAIGRMYGAHRATVTRWIATAKEAVFEATRAAVQREKSLSPATFESFARDAASQLDATLSTFLADSPP